MNVPHVSIDKDGSTVFTWWNGTKSLSIYFCPNGDLYVLKVWGSNIYNDMEEFWNPTELQWGQIWRWLS